jgi:hypothetical protein
MKPEQRQAAQAVVVKVARNFGSRSFRVDPRGPHYAPLKDAERMGLAWWPDDDRCALTLAGVEAAAEYSGGGA